MPELHLMNQRYLKYILYLLAIYVIGWGFTDYREIFLGLITGTVFSLFNLWTMVRKQKQFEKAFQEGKTIRSMGMLSRMAAAGLAVLIAMRYPDTINLISVVIGLMTIYVVIMIDFLIQHLRT
ncbi:ATP synthase subunit I [Bacillus sp. FJAT-42376]|uniref:ATP synthase subunit I n=1 Tax=Bacillus sp. FJAT-42376 TaxID=2014076 RepID=UPI000F4EF284|nr:ATP synthase subunit I [Bacillus sp. FJAT-42376]AZB40905.1 ATP synthase subunit I [Bacillus sp. FJAT-42376]